MDQIRVGTFDLYPSERTLRCAGQPLEIGARAFDLLLVLVENHGKLVTKATLLERVWPRVIVDENNLPAQIASLRRVLGAGAIRTVPGFGYRLELPVSFSAPATAAPTAVTPAERDPPRLNLPPPVWPDRLGPLIGRRDDVHHVRQALDKSRLVSIVGSAGVGKTRLAQEVLTREAEKPGAGAVWISLGPVEDLGHVPSAIALAMGLSLPDGVDGFVALRHALQQLSVLIVLDCVEHMGNALAAPLASVLAHAKGVRALVTSQAPLGVAEEIVYRLAALTVPDSDMPYMEAARFGAVEFFATRAAAADRRFELSAANTPLVTEICRRLDGNPLALELAAARVPSLGLTALLERLDSRFRLLKIAGPSRNPRHDALRAAFDWSYGLLTPAEQNVFDQLGAFAGSFSLNSAAHCVTDDTVDSSEAIDLIGRLVDRSLVTILATDPPRYTLLETARQYALERLSAGNRLQTTRKRVAAAMLDLLDLAYEEYWSLDEVLWLQRYEAELPNVRAVLDWAASNDRELGVALFGSVWPLFVEADLYAEGRARYMQMLPLLSDSLPRQRVARFWEALAAYDSIRQCDRARYAAELASRMYAQTENDRGRYFALMQFALNWRVDTEDACKAVETARTLVDPTWPSRLLTHGALTEGAVLTSAGLFDEARVAYRRAVKHALTTSERQALAATVRIVDLEIARGDTSAALQLGRPLAVSLRHIGRRDTHFDLLVLTFTALLIAGEIDEARTAGHELYDLALRLDTSKLYTALDSMAFLACEEKRYDAAARIAVCADAAHETHGQTRRRLAEQRMQNAVSTVLDAKLEPGWRSSTWISRDRLTEPNACALALGFSH